MSLVLLLPALSGCATRPSAPATVVLAAIVVDNLRLARPGETGLVGVWRAATRMEGTAGMVLQSGDRLETSLSATAVVRYPGGSEVLMRPGSAGRVGSWFAEVGEYFAKIKGKFAVETQFVRAGVLGTQFLLRVTPSGETTVAVFDGRVEVSSTRGAWPAQVVNAGSTVVAHPRAPVLSAARPDEVARTREWVERIEKLVPPVRTSGLSTGQTIALAAAVAVLGVAIAGSRDRGASPPPAAAPANPPPLGVGRDAVFGTSTPILVATPPALAAPRGTSPGAPSESSAQQLRCGAAFGALRVTLNWDAVAGATGYVVTLEQRVASGPWRFVRRSDVAGTSVELAAGTDGVYRWNVLARGSAGSGPVSSWQYFTCSVVR